MIPVKKRLLLWIGTFNYSREVVIRYTMAVTWAGAKKNFIDQLAREHGVERRIVAMMFKGDKDNFKIEIDREWREKHGKQERLGGSEPRA